METGNTDLFGYSLINKLLYYKSFLTCLICFISTNYSWHYNSINSADGPLSNKQANKQTSSIRQLSARSVTHTFPILLVITHRTRFVTSTLRNFSSKTFKFKHILYIPLNGRRASDLIGSKQSDIRQSKTNRA